ncbi:hypothetical protein, partial [Shewanella sp.]|uniref:hypothetical protein n=1 Tax=Shewanella sp. TaxID=50422 RepID=UPI0040488D1F
MCQPSLDSCSTQGSGFIFATVGTLFPKAIDEGFLHLGSHSRAHLNHLNTAAIKLCVFFLLYHITNALSPFLKNEWFSPGVMIYAMGNHQELDLKTYLSMTFIADERDQVKVCPDIAALMKSGDLPFNHVQADLGEVVGSPAKGRKSPDEKIIVRSQGLATQDVA